MPNKPEPQSEYVQTVLELYERREEARHALAVEENKLTRLKASVLRSEKRRAALEREYLDSDPVLYAAVAAKNLDVLHQRQQQLHGGAVQKAKNAVSSIVDAETKGEY